LAYQSQASEALPFHLAFLVLPLLLHRATLATIGSTLAGSGLSLFAAKLGEHQENIIAIHERALVLRSLTLQSIGVGAQTGLLSVNYEEALIRSNTLSRKQKRNLPERLRHLDRAADKIGIWFSNVSVGQIALTLKVAF
jgi:hypothetical protein